MKSVETRSKERLHLDLVLRTSLIVFFFLIGAKILNFLKKILIGNLFGVSWVADAFFAASYLPYHLAVFFEGVIFLGFLPLFSKVRAEKGEEEANLFLSEVLLIIFLLTVGAVLYVGWQSPWIIRELVPGFKANERELTQGLFQVLTLVLILISLTSFFKALNSYFGHYAVAASSAFVDSLVMLGTTLFCWKAWGIYSAAWGSVLGVFIAMILQALFLSRKNAIFPKKFHLRADSLKKLFYFFAATGAIWVLQQIPFVILNRFGSGMWEGTISALTIAQTLTTVPMGLVSHAVLFVIFPSMTKQAHEPSSKNLKETFFQTLRGAFLILIPLGFLITALARPLSALFFVGGGIGEEGTSRIANSLACLGWAGFALYADLFMTQSLIAVQKPFPAIFLCATRAGLTYFLSYFLSAIWDYQGLALSFSLALVFNLFFLFPLFFRMSPLKGKWRDLLGYSIQLILASSPVLLLGRFVSHWPVAVWRNLSQTTILMSLGLGFLIGMSLYVLLLSWLRVQEIHAAIQALKKSLRPENLVTTSSESP